MGLLTLPFRLPFLPVQGVIRLGELLQEEAERQLRDPARVRRDLEEAQRRQAADEISKQELTAIQDELTSTLVAETAPSPPPGRSEDRS
jgi:hypothetical protein